MHIAPLTQEQARDICTWRYPAPYDCYDMTGADPDALLRPEVGMHALLDGRRLVGFRSFGAFNTRALRVLGSLGFERVGRFAAATDGRSFEVLVRPER